MQQLSKRILWVWRIRALCLAAAGFFLCGIAAVFSGAAAFFIRSEEHTSELQSLNS